MATIGLLSAGAAVAVGGIGVGLRVGGTVAVGDGGTADVVTKAEGDGCGVGVGGETVAVGIGTNVDVDVGKAEGVADFNGGRMTIGGAVVGAAAGWMVCVGIGCWGSPSVGSPTRASSSAKTAIGSAASR